MGAWGVRVHHVPSTLDALRATYAIDHAVEPAIDHATDAGGPL